MRKHITPSMIVQQGIDSHRATLYHVMPGQVVTFHPGAPGVPPSADIQPAVHDVRFDLDTGERFSEPWPAILKAPILYPSFGPFVVFAPLSAGDSVLLLGFDLDPTAFLQTGKLSDPADTRRHAGSYWCAIPARMTVPQALKDGASSDLVVGVDGQAGQIRFPPDGSAVELGHPAGDFVALASKVSTELGKIKTTLDSLTGGGHFGTPYVPGPVASAVVKSG